MQITDRAKEERTVPLFRLGFRPFFLFGSLYGAWALLRWILILSGAESWEHAMPTTVWHSHELLFGFAMAIVSGFLTTAAQTWTGVRGIHGYPLAALFTLWLSARFAMNLYPDSLIGPIADAAFMLLSAGVLARQVILGGNTRNLIFLPIFACFIGVHLLQIWAAFEDMLLARYAGFAGIWLYALLIGLLGGRVIPFFIERRLNDKLPRDNLALIIGAQFSLLALVILTLSSAPQLWIQLVAGFAFLFHGWRCVRWYRHGIWKEPLLWSLYLSYLCLPAALLLLAINGVSQYSQVMHLLSVGLMSGMIMAMMCRVSLGHTGRALKAHPVAVLSMFAILMAALVRVILPWIAPSLILLSYKLAALFWLLSMVAFLWVYAPILVKPRADGQIG